MKKRLSSTCARQYSSCFESPGICSAKHKNRIRANPIEVLYTADHYLTMPDCPHICCAVHLFSSFSLLHSRREHLKTPTSLRRLSCLLVLPYQGLLLGSLSLNSALTCGLDLGTSVVHLILECLLTLLLSLGLVDLKGLASYQEYHVSRDKRVQRVISCA